jgi:short-subunit dehydrogenase
MALPLGVYGVSKMAAVSMCELLQKELIAADTTHVHVHCLCPPIANTNIKNSARNRPAELTDLDAPEPTAEGLAAAEAATEAIGTFFTEHGETAGNVVAQMIRDVQAGMFYTIMDNTEGFEYGVKEEIAKRMAGQISGAGNVGPEFVNEKMTRWMMERMSVPATADARL